MRTLTGGPGVTPFLRSGMSALLGLLALPSNGLAGGAVRLEERPVRAEVDEVDEVEEGFRRATPPSSGPSPTVV